MGLNRAKVNHVTNVNYLFDVSLIASAMLRPFNYSNNFIGKQSTVISNAYIIRSINWEQRDVLCYDYVNARNTCVLILFFNNVGWIECDEPSGLLWSDDCLSCNLYQEYVI